MKKKILTILGTRPELIKMFPIIDKLDKSFYNKLIWSGQHYDFSMVKQEVGMIASKIKSLRPPEPYKGKGIKEKGQYILRKEGKKNKRQVNGSQIYNEISQRINKIQNHDIRIIIG